jgi:asparagine synthetase B (glutamine-hydrolysing)
MDAIKSTFFIFAVLPENAPDDFTAKIKSYGPAMHVHQIPGQGTYNFTTPFYADMAEDDQMVWIKLGIAHDSERRYTTREMMQRGWLNPRGIEIGAFQGSVTLVGFLKGESRCYVFRNLLSPVGLVYRVNNGNFLLADNLRLMSHFLEQALPNEDAYLQHHINRQVHGERTYIKGVKNLLGGEMITCVQGEASLDFKQDFRRYEGQADQKQVNSETVAWFFDQLSNVIGFRVDGNESQAATLLSGGVDSSAMQAGINSRPGIDFRFPSISFVFDSPGFEFEVEYAREAVELLGTEHTFLNVDPEKFPDWLVTSVSILGAPVHFDAPPAYYAIVRYLEEVNPQIKYLFNGANADVLTGNTRTIELVQGDKYRNWPVWSLNLLAAALKPISTSKSNGARTAAEVLTSLRDDRSVDNPFNRSSTCDWDLLMKCFPQEAVDDYFQWKRDHLAKYSSSDYIVEQRQLLSLLQDGMCTPGLERQLGLFCGQEMWFPFSDDALVEAVLSFEPIDRYSHDHRVKPLMRMALESRIPTSVTRKQKGNSSAFVQAIIPWMREGSLRPLVQEIDRPGYISQSDFQKVLDEPDWFTWNLLTLDLFIKYGLK